MPPSLLIDLDQVDLTQVALTGEQIYDQILPQRFEFQVLDGICMIDPERGFLIAYADIKSDGWWVRGHIPGNPLLPGVVMLEMAGQTAAVGAKLLAHFDGFVAFGGVEHCKFRDSVVPPARLYVLGVQGEARRRRFSCTTQGVVDGRLVFEATIIGLKMS